MWREAGPELPDPYGVFPRFLSSTLFALIILGFPLKKPKSRKKGTLIIKGLLRNLVSDYVLMVLSKA